MAAKVTPLIQHPSNLPVLSVLRPGSIIPIAPGRMRNIYYPQRKAEYVTEAQMRTTNQKDLLAERDFSFGLPQTQPDPQPMEEIAIGVPTKLLTV